MTSPCYDHVNSCKPCSYRGSSAWHQQRVYCCAILIAVLSVFELDAFQLWLCRLWLRFSRACVLVCFKSATDFFPLWIWCTAQGDGGDWRYLMSCQYRFQNRLMARHSAYLKIWQRFVSLTFQLWIVTEHEKGAMCALSTWNVNSLDPESGLRHLNDV